MDPRLAGQRVTRFNEIFPLNDATGPHTTVPFSRAGPGVVWGIQPFAQGDHWFTANGSEHSPDIVIPPDTDSWYGGDHDFDVPTWYAGGSDGSRHVHAAIDNTGQWWVSVFDKDMTTLITRWQVPGWVIPP